MRPPYMERVNSTVPGETTTHPLGQRAGSWLIQKRLAEKDRKMIIDEIKKMIHLYESGWSNVLSELKDQRRLEDALAAININLGISSTFVEIEPNDAIRVSLNEIPHYLFLNTSEKKAFLVEQNSEQCKMTDMIGGNILKEGEAGIIKYINDQFKSDEEELKNIRVIERARAKAIKIESTYNELQFLFFDNGNKKTYLLAEKAGQCQETDINEGDVPKFDKESMKTYINGKFGLNYEIVAQVLDFKEIDLIKANINNQSCILFIDQDNKNMLCVGKNDKKCNKIDISNIDTSKEDNIRELICNKFEISDKKDLGDLEWFKALKLESEPIDKRSHFLFLSTKGEKAFLILDSLHVTEFEADIKHGDKNIYLDLSSDNKEILTKILEKMSQSNDDSKKEYEYDYFIRLLEDAMNRSSFDDSKLPDKIKSLTEIDEAIKNSSQQQPNLSVLLEYLKDLVNITSHDEHFKEMYPGYRIVGQQGCGDLTMNLWNVAYVNYSKSKIDQKNELIYLHEELLNKRTYSCLVKWNSSALSSLRPSLTIEDLRFNKFAKNAKEKVFVGPVGKYIFSWDELPGENKKRLQEILEQEFSIKNIKPEDIKHDLDNNVFRIKINDGKEETLFEIDDTNEPKLKYNGKEFDNFKVIREKGKIKIYENRIYKSENQNRGDEIEFAIYGKQVIRKGEILKIDRITSEFSDLRHLFLMPNLNPPKKLYERDRGRPRFYFGREQSEHVWFGEAELLSNPNTQKAACTGPVFLSRLYNGMGASIEQIRGAMTREGYKEIEDSREPLEEHQFRFVPEDDSLVEVYFRRNTYGWTMIGLPEDGKKIICLACQGKGDGKTGFKLEDAALELINCGVYNALVIDEGEDVFQVAYLGHKLPKIYTFNGKGSDYCELDILVPKIENPEDNQLNRNRLRATLIFARKEDRSTGSSTS